MTNIAHITETALLLLVAYLAGCVLGYAVRRVLHAGRGTRQPSVVAPAPMPVPAPVPAPEPAAPPVRRVLTPAARLAATASPEPLPRPAAKPTRLPPKEPRPKRQSIDPKPAALAAPRDGQADNLKQIKGIGPKIEASLNSLGVYHLDQIAAWTKANIDWIDGQLAFKGRIRRERWVEQATELTRTKVST